MKRLDPNKLFTRFTPGTFPERLTLPRRYTLTHSDFTGDLYLTIGSGYDMKQCSGLYTRLMRDEVLAEISETEKGYSLHVYYHVNGGFVLGTAKYRYEIFQRELPLVLESIRHGDSVLFENLSKADSMPVVVYFKSNKSLYNQSEDWGIISDYD
ncbi:MAG: staygreen family protein [Dehalococcoidales bacterium]|nr:MAG: staygreen family protein [Dehalococcoidales bacterium]